HSVPQPPQECGKPRRRGSEKRHCEAGKFGEHAFADQARHLRLKGLGMGGVVLDVVARPSQRGDGMAVGRAGMNAKRQAVALGRRINRPEMPAAERRFLHASTRICTKRRSLAQPPISSTPYSVFCKGTTLEARGRGSRSSHSLATQSLSARVKAKAMSSLKRRPTP